MIAGSASAITANPIGQVASPKAVAAIIRFSAASQQSAGRRDHALAQDAQRRAKVALAAAQRECISRRRVDDAGRQDHRTTLEPLDRVAGLPGVRLVGGRTGEQAIALQVGLEGSHRGEVRFQRGQAIDRPPVVGIDGGQRLEIGELASRAVMLQLDAQPPRARDPRRGLRAGLLDDPIRGGGQRCIVDRCVAAMAGLVAKPRAHDAQARGDAERLEVAVRGCERGVPAGVCKPLLREREVGRPVSRPAVLVGRE
ncbi:MAG TPA: hypothetical protein VF469_15990, partial [Kofleriaceae bacterium]